MLVVLRAEQPRSLIPRLERLDQLGIRHVEIAWSTAPGWSAQCLELGLAFPNLLLGAASICSLEALEASAQAGLSYGVSPVLNRRWLERGRQLGLTLVPGVFYPTEVAQAQAWGCAVVKLFPAITLGPHYWQRLAAPLAPLPFCIAAGGLAPRDVPQWLAAGVDALALGASLADPNAADPDSWHELQQWLATRPAGLTRGCTAPGA